MPNIQFKITSDPNENGEHSLKCPECGNDFLSVITKNDTTGAISTITCPSCQHVDEPKHFVTVAHQEEVNSLVMDYAIKELKKSFKNIKIQG